MSKKTNKSIWICSDCGGEHFAWSGKCSYCNSWNTLKELRGVSETLSRSSEDARPIKIADIKNNFESRIKTEISEFDLVSGGGIVPGSVILLGGHPGIGKSTLVWQIASSIEEKVFYIAGEESPEQIKIRANRLKGSNSNITIFENQDILSWLSIIEKEKPTLLIIDSIQTVYDSGISGSPGSIMQVKESAMKIINAAKKFSVATIFVGHVTKDGEVAGPKILEHLVDAVFYLDGERGSNERFLRSHKNRFGPTDELGVFTIGESGLQNSDDFGRISSSKKVPIGVAKCAVLEGSRIYFIEVQALVQKSPFAMPRRNAVGYDFNRLQMMIAILARHSKVDLSQHDCFVNISDGYKLKNPLGDLAILMALASSFLSKSLNGKNLFLGEVDLAGRLHLPSEAKKIIKAAKKIGFTVICADLPINELIKQNFS
ncbi:MAG: DNA repair protein RadA [Candidatus Berkelbacteria bacterium]|nr:DNA repair protein RadA [Candidatus Berkelbacteria bacterium]